MDVTRIKVEGEGGDFKYVGKFENMLSSQSHTQREFENSIKLWGVCTPHADSDPSSYDNNNKNNNNIIIVHIQNVQGEK